MEGLQRLAVGGLAATSMIEALMPNYALGQRVSRTDDRIKATYETVPSPKGNGSIKGYFVRPADASSPEAGGAQSCSVHSGPHSAKAFRAQAGSQR